MIETNNARSIKVIDVVLMCLVVFCGLFFRRYDAFVNPQIYAEDGPVFLQQYLENGASSLTMQYAGYLHTIPRLTAFVWGELVPLEFIPCFYNYTYLILALLVGLELLRCANGLGLRHNVLFASIFVLVPIGGDVYMNITNSIWVTSLYLVAFLFVGHKYYMTERRKGLKLTALTLVSLTGPFSLLLSPVALLIIILERKTMSIAKLVPFSIILLGGLFQFLLIVTHPSTRGLPGTPEEYHLFRLVIYLMNDLYFVRNNLPLEMSHNVNTAISAALFLFIVYLLVVNYRRISATHKIVLVLAPIVYLAAFIAAFWPMEGVIFAVDCPRYYFVPYTCVAWILLIGSDHLLRGRDVALIGVYFLLQGRNEQKILTDRKWAERVKEYREGKRQNIDINPEGWQLAIPPKK